MADTQGDKFAISHSIFAMKLHDVIRKLRQAKELTQENLADEIGVDKTTIIRYEKDGSMIQIGQLEKIAKAFGMKVSEILEFQDRKSIVEEPFPVYEKKRSVSITVELDGSKKTLDYWFAILRKFNASMT